MNNIKSINYNILASAPPPPPASTPLPTATTTHIATVPFPTTDTPPEPPTDLYTPNSSNGGHRLSAEVQDLFKRIFVKDPNKRITAGMYYDTVCIYTNIVVESTLLYMRI